MGAIKRTINWIKKESKRSGKDAVIVFWKMLVDYLRYGVNPKEYYYFHFDGKTDAEKKLSLHEKCSRSF